MRLTEKGYEIGLISEERYNKFLEKRKNVEVEVNRVKNITIKPTEEVNKLLESKGTSKITTGVKLADLIKRTELSYEDFKEYETIGAH